MTLRLRPAAAVAALLPTTVLAACSGGSSSTTAATSTAATKSSAPALTTAADDSQAFCATVREERATLAGDQLPKLLAGGSPEAWRAYLDATAKMNQKLVDTAPPEIKPAMLTLQSGQNKFRDALAAANYRPSAVGSVKLLGILRAPEQQSAQQQFVAYTALHCGIDLPKPIA